jgi:hypothetical protein
MYIEGGKVVLRESKNLNVFRLTEKYLQQLKKDLSFLRRFEDARIEWRISGKIDSAALDHLDGLVKEYPGLFNYRLDAPVP